MTKICHIIPFYGEQYGGSERYVEALASYQSSQGIDITVLSTTRYRNKVGYETKDGLKIVRCFSYKDIWNINPVSIILPSLSKLDIDLFHIHSHLYFTSNQAILWAKIKKLPVLLHLHGGIGLPPYQTTLLKQTTKSFYDKSIGKLMLKSANIIASVSLCDMQELKNTSKNISDNRFIHIPNIVNPSFNISRAVIKQKEKDEIFRIIYIGDIEPWKGINFLIHWLINNRGKKFDRDIKFQFIGNGSLTFKLQELERKFKNSDISVQYLGVKPHSMIPNYLRQAQALILPSYWEGLPTVVLEAMLLQVPVLTTPVGDLSYIIKPYKTGLFFNPSDNSLNNVINFSISNPLVLRKISERAYQLVIDNYTVPIIHKKVLKIYNSLLSHM